MTNRLDGWIEASRRALDDAQNEFDRDVLAHARDHRNARAHGLDGSGSIVFDGDEAEAIRAAELERIRSEGEPRGLEPLPTPEPPEP